MGGLSEEAREDFIRRIEEGADLGFKTPGADTFEGRDIIILAMGPSRGYCPFDTETWAVNQGYFHVYEMHGRLDKLFLAHGNVYSAEGNPLLRWDEINSLADAGVEVINTHKVKGLKAKMYPMNQIIKRFGIDYFSDTICYMIAYALYVSTRVNGNGKPALKHPLRLKIYGVDIQDRDEYQFEKPGIEFWIGYALGLGVEITNSFGSTLLTTVNGWRYGVKPPQGFYDPSGIYKRELRKLKGSYKRDVTSKECK